MTVALKKVFRRQITVLGDRALEFTINRENSDYFLSVTVVIATFPTQFPEKLQVLHDVQVSFLIAREYNNLMTPATEARSKMGTLSRSFGWVRE